MTKFTASNGVVIVSHPGGSVHWEAGTLPTRVGAALREFFRHERDEELGRWRWPENPDYVVQRVDHEDDGDGRCVMTISESEASVIRCWEFIIQGGDDTHQEAARAYFAAHPVSKPWHDAKPGEVWVITYLNMAGYEVTNPALRTDAGEWKLPLVTVEITDAIVSARRIWPEASNG